MILLCHNQEKYIEKAFTSIVSQNFSGTWEVIIGDDQSTDSTWEILQSKISFSNILIKAYRNENNLGLARNYEKAFALARGKYIAYLEGDDYWTDYLKIQKQFDALETNPEFSLAFHDFIYIDKNSKMISDSNLNNGALRKNRTVSEMISGCLIHQNTIMFRRNFQKLPIWFFLARNHDTWLLAYLSSWGPALYVQCEPLHYRILDNSLWSSLSQIKKQYNGFITTMTIFQIAPIKYYPALLRKLGSKVFSIIKLYLK